VTTTWLRTECDLYFEAALYTPFIFMLRPRSGAEQWVAQERYAITPSVPVTEFTDGYGNLCQRLIAPPGSFAVRTSADVMTSAHIDTAPGVSFVPVQDLPESVLTYLLPSRYCEVDRLSDLARGVTMGATPGYDQVAAINVWVQRAVRYAPGSSLLPASAVEVRQRGVGVCRDLAHLAISLCRSLVVPARLVVGYLKGLEPMDLHAWFEAYVGGRWYTFDPTQPRPRGGRVAIAYGRDAADVAVYSQYGPTLLPTAMRVSVQELSKPPG
jgi:transglutaminase-like putative cysteine protease